MPAWNVDTDPPQRPYPLPHRRPAPARLPRAAQLPFVEVTHIFDGYPEAFLDLRRERLSARSISSGGTLIGSGPHAVEAFGVLKDGFIAPLAHVLDDPARCVRTSSEKKAAGTAQSADDLAGVPLSRV